MSTLYITGAGVSAESGIPTFRGKDGYWTIGSKNYTPQEMATMGKSETV
jgi:NAD-dependent deacetylase